MRIYKNTVETVCFTEEEAKDTIEKYRNDAAQGGYIVGAAGYTYKTKKAKGEIIGEVWLTKVSLIYGDIWEELVNG